MPMTDFCDDLARAVAFLSRIPVADRFFTGHDGRMSRMVRAFPLAGLVIALPAAIVFGLLLWLPADPLLASLIALAVLTLTTGALHEDGLGDTADGLGGGRDREQALAIMKDSRIGSYGAIALILSFALRAAALAAIATALPPLAAAATVLAAAVASRAAMVWHWRILPPAKSLGVAAAAGRPDGRPVQLALASATLLVAVLLIPALSLAAFLAAVLLTAALTHAVTNRIRTALGGHTGDTIGATQQIAEITTLCALALAA